MNARIKISLSALAVITATAVVMVIARQGFAWNNPGSNPPSATPAISMLGGNIGIGTTGPGYKLDVSGDVNATRLCIAGSCQSSWPVATATSWPAVTNKSLGDVARNDSTLDIGVSQYMRWKNYGNGHVIIDASNGTAPSGAAIDNTNSQVAWAATYPTLMGWNGANTYGVRVDSARVADSATDATKVAKAGDTMTGTLDITGGSATDYTNAPIEIRTTATPRVSFHWPGVVASQIGMDSSGTIRTYDNPGTGYANFAAGSITSSGNLNFGLANPTISASSYFTAPGGAYFNSGTVYAEAAIQARGGIHNDSGSYLMLQGGTTGKTQLSGALRFADGTEQTTAVQAGSVPFTRYENNLRVVRGTVAQNGAILGGSGFTVTVVQNGVYTLTWTNPWSAAPTIVVSASDAAVYTFGRATATNASVFTVNGLGNYISVTGFNFTAIGPN